MHILILTSGSSCEGVCVAICVCVLRTFKTFQEFGLKKSLGLKRLFFGCSNSQFFFLHSLFHSIRMYRMHSIFHGIRMWSARGDSARLRQKPLTDGCRWPRGKQGASKLSKVPSNSLEKAQKIVKACGKVILKQRIQLIHGLWRRLLKL